MDTAVYYDMSTNERRHWWYRARREIVMERLKRHIRAESLILDVGCGTGYMSEGMVEFGEVYAWDANPLARELFPSDSPCRLLTNPDLAADAAWAARFDVLSFFDVIEHVENEEDFLADWLKTLKPGGKVVVTVPAFMLFWGHHDVVSRHHRRYTRDQLRSLMNRLGLIETDRTYFNLLLSPAVLLTRLTQSLRALSRLEDSGDLALPSPWVNEMLYQIFTLESSLLRRIRFPFGVSFLGVYQKPVQAR